MMNQTVMKALSELYEAYYKVDNDVSRQRIEVEVKLGTLMHLYDVWLDAEEEE